MSPAQVAVWFLLPLLAACSMAKWDKPGATDASIQADGEQCWEKARVQARSFTSQTADGLMVGGPVDRGRDRAMDEQGLYQQCMRDKGYSEKR